MAPFHGMALLLLGIGYLLHAEPLHSERGIALSHRNDDTGKGEKSCHCDPRKTYISEEIQAIQDNVTVAEGETAVLSCRVRNRGNKFHLARVCVTQVIWTKQQQMEPDILTYNLKAFTSDNRFTVVNSETDVWDLKIVAVQLQDEGIYMCQVTTKPPIEVAVTLKVLNVTDEHAAAGTGRGEVNRRLVPLVVIFFVDTMFR